VVTDDGDEVVVVVVVVGVMLMMMMMAITFNVTSCHPPPPLHTRPTPPHTHTIGHDRVYAINAGAAGAVSHRLCRGGG
jgi:hypothetical protein